MRQIPLLVFSALVTAAMATPVAATQLIVNGGFELGTFKPISSDPSNSAHYYDTISQSGTQDLTGWTVGNSLVWGYNPIDINVHAGQGFVDLTGVGDTIPHGILNQTIPTLVGQQYTFSIFVTQDFSTSIIPINVFADGVALVLSGTPGFWNYSATGATYGQLTGVFIATDTSTDISIQGIAFGSTVFMIGLDDVSVIGPALDAVPVPGALSLFATGLGALGVVLRRRKRKNAAAIGTA